VRSIIAGIERLFPSLKGSQQLHGMVVCATEIANNAAAREDNFPIAIRMERRGSSLFFESLQSKRFSSPPIALPENMLSEGGRGLYIVDALTQHNLRIEGENGRAWFIYPLRNGEGSAPKKFQKSAQVKSGA